MKTPNDHWRVSQQITLLENKQGTQHKRFPTYKEARREYKAQVLALYKLKSKTSYWRVCLNRLSKKPWEHPFYFEEKMKLEPPFCLKGFITGFGEWEFNFSDEKEGRKAFDYWASVLGGLNSINIWWILLSQDGKELLKQGNKD